MMTAGEQCAELLKPGEYARLRGLVEEQSNGADAAAVVLAALHIAVAPDVVNVGQGPGPLGEISQALILVMKGGGAVTDEAVRDVGMHVGAYAAALIPTMNPEATVAQRVVLAYSMAWDLLRDSCEMLALSAA